MSTIEKNLQEVRERMMAACRRVGRGAETVRLIAVTKTVGEEEIRELYRLGIRDYGENRVEVLLPKLEALADLQDVRWHFIGHLQRNKAKKVLPWVAAIHSVESAGLLEIIAGAENKPDVFLEVSISGEESKYGLPPQQVPELVAAYKDRINIVGLMTMAPFFAEPEDTREVFAGLRRLRDKIAGEQDIELAELSIGMSNDFEVAIEEGATRVRVGSELFK